MKTVNVTIQHEAGLHARPASVFVKIASTFSSEIRLIKDDATVNGKSIMGVLMLALGAGNTVQLEVEGSDEQEAIVELSGVLSGEFGEK